MASKIQYKGKTILEGWPATLAAILLIWGVVSIFTLGMVLFYKLLLFAIHLVV